MTKEKVIKSYKGFDKNMQCQGFQYEVGKEYKIDGDIKCCERGFHACESPMEVWNFYDMLDSRFAEVEQSGKIDKDGRSSTKVCSSHIKIKAELKLADFINLGIEWLKDITSPSKIKPNTLDATQICSSGYSAKIGSSGYSAKIGSSGDYAKICSSGDYAKICSSGNYTWIGSSSDSAQIGSSGNYTRIGSSGDSAKICSSGVSAQIGSSGVSARIGSNGNYAKIGSSGDSAKICSNGVSARIGSSGNSAKIDSTGEDSIIMCAGIDSTVKAKKGSWITLAEWVWDDEKKRKVPKCVKTEFVDGKRIKEDTWYQIKNGEFVEAENYYD